MCLLGRYHRTKYVELFRNTPQPVLLIMSTTGDAMPPPCRRVEDLIDTLKLHMCCSWCMVVVLLIMPGRQQQTWLIQEPKERKAHAVAQVVSCAVPTSRDFEAQRIGTKTTRMIVMVVVQS